MPNSSYTFQAALLTYTRLPISYQRLNDEHFTKALAWLPAVGFVVALLCGLVLYLGQLFLPPLVAIVLALLTGVIITGALHEDGFADCCDGFFASQDKQTILRIMKDSSNGSFATLGLIGLWSIKLAAYWHILPELFFIALIAQHTIARYLPLLIICTTPHCQAENSKMSANLVLSQGQIVTTGLLLFVLNSLLFSFTFSLLLAAALALLTFFSRSLFIQRLQGYNGDCLGAIEQVGECLILLIILAYF